MVVVAAFALLHAWHLNADFPNQSPWLSDWAKYTDEGWWANAAVRTHLFGHWYQPGDFNPAAGAPLMPALEWLVFALTGVSLEAARALAVLLFFANLALSYLLIRSRWPRWAGLLAVTLMAVSPFLYCFSRLAILEPALMACTLGCLNVGVRAGRWRRPGAAAALAGLFFALMMFTKTTAIFLLPAMAWGLVTGLRRGDLPWSRVLRATAIAGAVAAVFYGSWLLLLAGAGLLADYRYLFFINDYAKPPNRLWPLFALYWSFHGALWINRVVVPLAGIAIVAAAARRMAPWSRELLLDPVFGASFWAIAGYILFMTVQNHPQPRYFVVVAFFTFILIGISTAAMAEGNNSRRLAVALVAVAAMAAVSNAKRTLDLALHPQYTWVNAARNLTSYIDAHPNGNRLLVSISGDQITLMTHLPSLCDDFGTLDLATKIGQYQPGWYAAWNDLDPGTLQELHTQFSLEQVAEFPALDDPDRNLLVLFKLHPLPGGLVRPDTPGMAQPQPGDKIDVIIE